MNLLDRGVLEPHGDRRGAWYSVAGDSSQSTGDSSQSARDSSQSTDDGPPELGEVANKKWANKAVVEKAILGFCKDAYRTVRQIASRLGRKPSTIQKNYVTALVRKGQLVLLYPESPNRPDQAYKAT
jgi:hypothetical protein